MAILDWLISRVRPQEPRIGKTITFDVTQDGNEVAAHGDGIEANFAVSGINLPANVDANFAVWGLLPRAMEEGFNLHLNRPIDPVVAENAARVSKIWETWVPNRYRSIKVSGEAFVDDLGNLFLILDIGLKDIVDQLLVEVRALVSVFWDDAHVLGSKAAEVLPEADFLIFDAFLDLGSEPVSSHHVESAVELGGVPKGLDLQKSGVLQVTGFVEDYDRVFESIQGILDRVD